MGFLPTMSIVATETQYPGIKPAQDRMRLPTPKLYSLPLTIKMGSILLINISSTCIPNCTENDRGVQSKSVLPVSSATVGGYTNAISRTNHDPAVPRRTLPFFH